MERDEILSFTGAVAAADATFGSAIPVDVTRYIWRIRWISNLGAEQLLVGRRENGAGATTNIDTLDARVPGQQQDPEELHEDSAPLYVIRGGPSRGQTATVPPSTSLFRLATTVGAGTVTIWYTDSKGS
ncbi:MAG: hypothetical protein WCY09_09575 [Candidatus Omnitrophota bacterium]